MTHPQYINIIPAGPFEKAYTYAVDGNVTAGTIVTVPVGGSKRLGVVWETDVTPTCDPARVKAVTTVHTLPPVREALRTLVDWMKGYTMAPLGQIVKMCVSGVTPETAPVVPTVYALADPVASLKITAPRQRVLDALQDAPLSLATLRSTTQASDAVIRGLEKAGAIQKMAAPPPSLWPDAANPFDVTLSEVQTTAAHALEQAVRDDQFSVTVLDGVTGSGKTEVYMHAIDTALQARRQALILMPEIALTDTMLDRFTKRFGAAVVPWHSGLSPGRRNAIWRGVAAGDIPLVIGARSALFLPFAQLGLIVVDEEHEHAYKQEEVVLYHARDMAVARGRCEQAPVVLVSATPSLESLQNCHTGRYTHLHLPHRFGEAVLPDVTLVDMRAEKMPSGRWISNTLLRAMAETLAAREQALLFLNRRGYAPLTLCKSCGYRIPCTSCQAWMVQHKRHGRLLCHHCGYSMRLPDVCPECGAEDSFIPCGPGVERVAEEAAMLFPEARLQMVSSDTAPSGEALKELFRSIGDGAVDIVVGTQILAKGHHFPRLTLVGVVDGDLGLHGDDLRAAERTYQLLHQVAGRAGRAAHKGRVLLQTYRPDQTVLQALQHWDRDGFVDHELAERADVNMPPFGRLAALIVSGLHADRVEQHCRTLARVAPQIEGVNILGPAPPPMAYVRKRHRRRFLLQARRDINIQKVIHHWLSHTTPDSAVRVQVDIDPMSFM